MARKFYAVKKGRNSGIFDTWEECKANVNGYPGAQYKSFPSLEEAKGYLEGSQRPSLGDTDHEESCTAYVDGSFDQEKNAYSYGCILLYRGERIEMSRVFQGGEDISMRNVAGELEGAMAAMKFCEERRIKVLHLYYDYQGIESWAVGDWKRNRPGTIRYKSFYDGLKNVKVVFHKVKGHSGVELNEAVDRLAKAALGI